jgi:hypothetical protein
MTSGYRYTERDLLQGAAYHYHYTPYEGAALLPAYRRDRSRALDRLAARKGLDETVIATAGTAAGQAAAPPCAGIFGRPVDTNSELAKTAAWVARGGDPLDANLVAFVDALIRKFEITKRLRSRYGVGLAVEERNSAGPDAYCYLAYLVARRPSGADLLWCLNALLKLNDLLLSTDTAALPPTAEAAWAEALRRELDMVAGLAARKGVTLE